MRVVLISDIHGNLLALEAVLRDAGRTPFDAVACLGDTATLGPQPREVLALLRTLRCHCIMGNHDAFLLDPQLVRQYTQAPVIVDAVDWCRAQLREEDLRFVGGFASTLSLPLGAERNLLLFHGSPSSHTHDLLATDSADDLDAQLSLHDASVLAGGHTHIQLLRQHRGRWLVNPGSVGMPFRSYVAGARPEIMPYAEYAVLHATEQTLSVELKRVALERAALRRQVARWEQAPRLLQADLLLQYA